MAMLVLSLAFCGSTASALTVSFSDFSSTTGLTLNGSASVVNTSDGDVLRLTPASPSQSGSFFSSTAINASSFSSYFTFRITEPGGSPFDGNTDSGADGLVFVIQSVSSSIGGVGQGIGYEGIGTSVGIEFDTWHNSAYNDPDSNHLGINTNGNMASVTTEGIATRFDDENLWHAWVDYDGTTLEVRTNQTGVRPGTSTLSYNLDIVNLLGQSSAFVGFTSGTGADWGNHDIVSWEYRDDYDPVGLPIPEPATMSLLGLGLAGLAARRMRKTSR
jgi:hypothetical protein